MTRQAFLVWCADHPVMVIPLFIGFFVAYVAFGVLVGRALRWRRARGSGGRHATATIHLLDPRARLDAVVRTGSPVADVRRVRPTDYGLGLSTGPKANGTPFTDPAAKGFGPTLKRKSR